MSFLFPLFLAGAIAIGVPLYLHLRQRRTTREVPFSSLMFLSPTAVRFESRRRLEHVVLLIVRALAVAALAAAFARPYFTRAVPGLAGSGERLVVLLDTSASMRREGLFSDAIDRVKARVRAAGAGDRVSVLAFDRNARSIVSFDEWGAAPTGEREVLAAGRLATVSAGWGGTDLGRALLAATDALLDDEAADAEAKRPPATHRRVVLVSDLQQGARLEGFSARDVPPGVSVEVDAVRASPGVNASALWLEGLAYETSEGDGTEAPTPPRGTAQPPATTATKPPAKGPAKARVRLQATPDGAEGKSTRVRLRWDGVDGAETTVELAAGTSRVVEVPPLPSPAAGAPGGTAAAAGGATLLIEGDESDFDNRVFVAPPLRVSARILYFGTDDGTGAPGPFYFLGRAFPATALRDVKVVARRPDASDLERVVGESHFVVVSAPLGERALASLTGHLDRGRAVFVTAATPALAPTVAALAGRPGLALRAAPADRFAVIAQVDLAHPWLQPFADPQFSDFSKIRFWKRVLVDPAALPSGTAILGRFDDGAPALIAAPARKGQVVVLASGLHPDDSQLVLSTKFVPLVNTLLAASAGLAAGRVQHWVGEPVPLEAVGASAPGSLLIRKPDGREVTLARGATSFDETDQPGLYTIEGQGGGGGKRVFAVNLPPSESATAPRALDALEGIAAAAAPGAGANEGGAAGSAPDRAGAWARELEGRQRFWRWVMLALMVALVLETWLGGRLTRRTRVAASASPEEASA